MAQLPPGSFGARPQPNSINLQRILGIFFVGRGVRPMIGTHVFEKNYLCFRLRPPSQPPWPSLEGSSFMVARDPGLAQNSFDRLRTLRPRQRPKWVWRFLGMHFNFFRLGPVRTGPKSPSVKVVGLFPESPSEGFLLGLPLVLWIELQPMCRSIEKAIKTRVFQHVQSGPRSARSPPQVGMKSARSQPKSSVETGQMSC